MDTHNVLRYMSTLSFNMLLQYTPYVSVLRSTHQPIAVQLRRSVRQLYASIHTTHKTQQLRSSIRSRRSADVNSDYVSYSDQQRHAQSIALRQQLYSADIATVQPVCRHSMYNEIAEHEIDGTGRTYGSEFHRVELLVRSGDMAQAKQHFHRIIEHADISSWHTYLAGYTRHSKYIHQFSDEWQLFVQHQKPNTISYSILARGLLIYYDATTYNTVVNNIRTNKRKSNLTRDIFILDIVQQMKQTNVAVNTFVYNLLLQQLFEAARYPEVVRYYNEMKAANQSICAPDCYTYNTLFRTLPLLKVQCSTDEYIKYWNEMKSYNILPNMVLYRVIMSHLAEHHQYELFYELYYDLIYRKVVPDLQLMRVILNVCCRLNRSDDALLAYKYMKQHRIIPTATIYNSIMTIFARRGDVNAVLIFWNELCKHNVQPNLAVLSALMQTFTNAGDMERAVEVFTSANSFNLQPNAYTYSTLFEALKHDTVRLLKHFDEMKQRQLPITDVIYTQVLESCKATDNVDTYLVYLSEMLDNNHTPQMRDFLYVATNLLTQARTSVEQQQSVQPDVIEGFQILSELMDRANIYLTIDWYQHYIDFHMLCHDCTALNDTVQSMLQHHTHPSIPQLQDIMQYCMDHQQHVYAVEIYYTLRSSSRCVRYLTYDLYHLMIECFGVLDLVDELLHILHEMQSNKHYASYTTLKCLEEYCIGPTCTESYILTNYIRHLKRHVVALKSNHMHGYDTEAAIAVLNVTTQTTVVKPFQFQFKFTVHGDHILTESTVPPLQVNINKTKRATTRTSKRRQLIPGEQYTAAVNSVDADMSETHHITGNRTLQKRRHKEAARRLERTMPRQYISQHMMNNDNTLSNINVDFTNSGDTVDKLYTSFMNSANSQNTTFTAGCTDAYNAGYHIDLFEDDSVQYPTNNGYTKEGVAWSMPLRETPCVHYWSVAGCKSVNCKFLHESNANKLNQQQIDYLINKSRRVDIKSTIQRSKVAQSNT